MSDSEIIARALREKRTNLSEAEAKDLVRAAGIPVVATVLVQSQRRAVAVARDLGFPVALKIASPDIIHKSDAGGVVLGLKNASEVTRAYRDIMAAVAEKAPQARIDGITVQQMAPPGVEVIIGMSKDPQFGPVLMFGLGGILVELLKDISFRIIPLTARDAMEMMKETKGFPLLTGYRGHEGVDLDALQSVILKVASFIEATPRIKELDLNPTIAGKSGAVVADARIVLETPTR